MQYLPESTNLETGSYAGLINKCKSMIYGLLCQREKGGQWEKFLDTIFVEFIGLQPYLDSINYWMLLGKLGSLKYLSYHYFRKTIFQCMNLLGDDDG